MKELSIEQKAERYDEALKVLHKYDGANIMFSQSLKEEMFPELKEESENERVRKGLIELVKQSSEILEKKNQEQMINWLENQCNKEPITCPICGWEIKKQDEQLQGKSALEVVEEKVDNANKIEPKFNIDDWVVNKFGDVWHIDSFDNKNYQVSNGNKYNYFPISSQNEMHIWTIQDAKDGDILVCKSDKKPFIFKGLLDKFHPDCPVAYCGLSEGDTFEISTGNGWWTDEEVLPATKEQIEQLMKVITDEGYEWNPEKKELKRVKDEPENHKRWIGSDMTNSVKDHIGQNPTDKEIKKLLQTEYEKGRADAIAEMQKPAWSEEDEMFVHGLIRGLAAKRDIHGHTTFSSDCIDITETINWLEFIKYRVQPKQEWSEEDEEHIKSLLERLEGMCKKDATFIRTKFAVSEDEDWLKSLKDRPQLQWKPSEGQLDVFIKNAIDFFESNFNPLTDGGVIGAFDDKEK